MIRESLQYSRHNNCTFDHLTIFQIHRKKTHTNYSEDFSFYFHFHKRIVVVTRKVYRFIILGSFTIHDTYKKYRDSLHL